jgi:hypothetical protein
MVTHGHTETAVKDILHSIQIGTNHSLFYGEHN